ncbi:hypothetical protein BN2476_1410007 [Paraburkholderia piptadeniae]|uniref:Uncharacterized protein n=1 Tax=Paraburkholderia piptadeniae TaxID=1701573 RepID=A0A1N7SWH3_9BURK|nr:hypothetical protein BN2476_1410007 [Paraburkholderia piptadeniae]
MSKTSSVRQKKFNETGDGYRLCVASDASKCADSTVQQDWATERFRSCRKCGLSPTDCLPRCRRLER